MSAVISDSTNSPRTGKVLLEQSSRSRELSMRQVANAILYILQTDCQWRQLLREFVNSWSGARLTTIFTADPITGHGNVFTICCVLPCEKNVGDTNSRRQAAWIQSVKCTAVPG
ncbi:transposase [Nitrosomonas communis]|uniref:transposase n=1 Tax=Nitrosomonas communis TaxID=44574 RepID=UPI0034E963E2|nr:transposase [Nitrosomonas communis]